MNARSASTSLMWIVLIFIGFDATASLWIPIPRGTNALSQLIRSMNGGRVAGGMAAMKRDARLPATGIATAPGPNENGITYAVESPLITQARQPNVVEPQNDGQDFNMDEHWPITPRACLVLMKILHAQTAEIIERGNSDMDFFEAASYYQPAIRTLSKCMDMADRGYENVILK